MFKATMLGLSALSTLLASAYEAHGREEHPREHTDQFLKQCLEATDNPALCDCALGVFVRFVPADGPRLYPENRGETFLLVNEVDVLRMLPYYHKCEIKYGQVDKITVAE